MSSLTLMTMRLRPQTLERVRSRPVRRGPSPARPAAPPPAPDTPLTRAKREGGPQDNALYSCGCGYVFEASVSATVGCPHCGTEQAW
jgi:hypothetical protein